MSGDTSCSILPNSSILCGDRSEYDSIIGIALIHCIVIKIVNSQEYEAIVLISLTVIILFIASDQLPPTFEDKFEFLFELEIYIAINIAQKSKIDADNTKNSKPEFVNESDNLTDISEPKMAPKDPPAIINPYNFLDFVFLNILITSTQNIETTKKEYMLHQT